MASLPTDKLPAWTWLLPLLAVLMLVAKQFVEINALLLSFAVVFLGAAVFSAVHHAEVIAHRVGEPFGTLVLSVAVTVIEVALIVSVMLTGGPEKAALARDTVFAAVMAFKGLVASAAGGALVDVHSPIVHDPAGRAQPRLGQSASAMSETSTEAPSGSSATPTASRACLPASPLRSVAVSTVVTTCQPSGLLIQ